jgi:hypothetical protein
MANPVRVALMTPAKPERRNAPRRRYPELPLDIQHFHWKPLSSLAGTPPYARKLRIGR